MFRKLGCTLLRSNVLKTNISWQTVSSTQKFGYASDSKNFQIRNLDHLVLTVRDLEKTLDFYTRVLGMESTTFKGGRKALNFGDQKINLHVYGQEFEPKALTPTPGSADLCFITSTSLEDVSDHFEVCEVPIIEGPVERTGAQGKIRSVYVRDPDDNLIEIANYVDKA